jgi:hypothetical protein
MKDILLKGTISSVADLFDAWGDIMFRINLFSSIKENEQTSKARLGGVISFGH